MLLADIRAVISIGELGYSGGAKFRSRRKSRYTGGPAWVAAMSMPLKQPNLSNVKFIGAILRSLSLGMIGAAGTITSHQPFCLGPKATTSMDSAFR